LQLRELKDRVDALERERRLLDEKLKSQQAKYDYEPLKQRVSPSLINNHTKPTLSFSFPKKQALELRTEYNRLLVNAALGKQKSHHASAAH
jgi:hypothetical protein